MKPTRMIILLLISILISIGATELLMRVFDPIGLAFFDDIVAWNKGLLPDPEGYKMPDGIASFTRWSYTVENGYRITPANHPNGETVYFVGDSLTFGWGVQDDQTWVNLITDELDLNGINVGKAGYNIGNFVMLIETLPPEACIVHLSVPNDYEMGFYAGEMEFRVLTTRWSQLFYFLRSPVLPSPIETFNADYRAKFQQMQAHSERFLTIAYDPAIVERLSDLGVMLIPPYTSNISAVDSHPDAVGHRQLYHGILPLVREFVQQQDCPSL